jgi:hypothetical protein
MSRYFNGITIDFLSNKYEYIMSDVSETQKTVLS